MTTTTDTTTAPTTVSLWISQDTPRGYKEEGCLHFDASWRGRPVSVTMQADRYEHSSGISDWRIYATEAREGHAPTLEDGRRGRSLGDHLTETARHRLSDELKPAVAAWIASDAYTAARASALAAMILRRIEQANKHYGTREARQLLATYAGEIPSRAHVDLTHLADTLDAYRAELDTVAEAIR